MVKVLKSFLLVFVFSVLSASGQTDSRLQDVLILKDGRMLKGYILDTDSVNITLVVYGDKVFVINSNEVVQQLKQPPGKITLFNERRFNENGFQSQVELLGGISTNDRHSIGIRFINGYKFNHNQFIGLGVGATNTSDYYGGLIYFGFQAYPIFIRYSHDLWKNRPTPYVFTDFGSNMKNSKLANLTSPMYLRFGLGNKFITKKHVWYTAISYSQNKARNYYSNGFKNVGYSDWYRNHNVELSFGWLWN